MVTLVWRTDVHLSDSPPRSRTDDWAETVLGKLVQVGEIAREVGADAVIDGGDFFHHKSPSRTSHALIQRVAQVHQGYPCPVYALTGNHDVKYGDPEFLPESPLGVLISTGVFRPLEDVSIGDVRVVGVPYHGKTYDMDRLRNIRKGSERHLMVVAHLLASQAGGEMFGSEDIVRYTDLVDLDPDVWCFGHWHKNQGVTCLQGKTIVNVGSLTRGALSEDELHRVPEAVVLRFTPKGCEVERRPLDISPPERVFDLDQRVRGQAQQMNIEAFVERMGQTLTPMDGDLVTAVRQLGLPAEAEERFLLYLEEV